MIAQQLRRRRAASRRCQPLEDGRRDPIDPPRRGRTIHVRAISVNTEEWTGCDHAVGDALRQLDARFQRAPRGGAWLVHTADSGDVMALLESRSYRIELVF